MRLRVSFLTILLALLVCRSSFAGSTLFSWASGSEFSKCAFVHAFYSKSIGGVVFTPEGATKPGEDAAVGAIETPQMTPPKPFDQVVPSWSSFTPDGAYLIVLVKIRVDGKWTRWYKMELYNTSSKPEPKKSYRDSDDTARVGMDTLELKAGKKADAVQMRIELRSTDGKTYPTLHFMSVNTNDPAGMVEKTEPIKSAWGVELDVPYLSQLSVPNGNIYCSPTSTAMVLGYWAKKLNRPEMNVGVQKAVDNVLDHTSPGTGHWSFNTAYAGEFKGMIGYVDRFSSLTRVEWWISRGVPVIVSHDYGVLCKWKNPAGHLAVIRGFTKEGDVVFNDPWTPKDKLDQVRKVFKRAEFEHCWLGKVGSQGTVYIIYPESLKSQVEGGTAMRVKASYYQQFDADSSLGVPGEGYGGWRESDIEIVPEHTAVVVMHAWDTGTPEQYPGWYRAVEYIPRAQSICREVFPPLLDAVRKSGLKLFHVVSAGNYYKDYPGYKRALDLAGPVGPAQEQVPSDPVMDRLRGFRAEHVFVGKHNEDDVARGFANLDFAPEARPVGDEGIAENSEQLFALCKDAGVNHIIYAGFAIDWCLLISPGGMVDMSRRGMMCSAIRQAVTAVENKETARKELGKQIALWRVALAFGFVFDAGDLTAALRGEANPRK